MQHERQKHKTSCQSLNGTQLYCRKCDSHQGPYGFEKNAPDGCYAEMLQEHPRWDDLGDEVAKTEEDRRRLRFSAYRIVTTDIAQVRGKCRREVPECCKAIIIEAGFGQSKSGFRSTGVHSSCTCSSAAAPRPTRKRK